MQGTDVEYRWLMPASSSDSTAEMAFAENLKTLREDRGLSQGKVAEMMADRGFKWHQATVYKIENGSRQVQLGEARAVAEILGVPLDRMTDGTENIVALSRLREEIRQFKILGNRLEQVYYAYQDAQFALQKKIDETHPFGDYNPTVVSMLSEEEREEAKKLADTSAKMFVDDLAPF